MAGADWTIRRAISEDAAPLTACIDAAYAHYRQRITDLPDVSADCAAEIKEDRVWVAIVGDVIAGGIVLAPQDGFLQLVNVAVHPDHRGTGLGRALIERAEAEARNLGYAEMRLTTHRDMPENLKLYTHLGWDLTGRSGSKLFMRKAV